VNYAPINGILQAWYNKLQVVGIFCDLAKAFKRVNHILGYCDRAS